MTLDSNKLLGFDDDEKNAEVYNTVRDKRSYLLKQHHSKSKNSVQIPRRKFE